MVGAALFGTFLDNVEPEPVVYAYYGHPMELPREEPEMARTRVEQLIADTFPEDVDTALRIAKCESGLRPDAYNDRNTNGSVDRGLMQLNSVHDPRLAELGLDPWDIEDNLTFARLLYEERGWLPWVCFHKLAQR